MEAPLCEPKCVTQFEGEGGALLSIRHAMGESRSSRSSSLVYPLLCTIDTFLSSFRLPSMSATFSAASDVEGVRYTTGAAMCGKALITSLLVQHFSKLYSIKYYVGNNVSKTVSVRLGVHNICDSETNLRIQLLQDRAWNRIRTELIRGEVAQDSCH
jgi:hypothetical protein